MKYKLIIRPEAEVDLSEAFSWYEEKRKGLGHDFLLQVEAGFCFLEENPYVFPERYKESRFYLIKRFPYNIIYQVEALKVIVLAVVYGGRNPKWIKKRVRKRL